MLAVVSLTIAVILVSVSFSSYPHGNPQNDRSDLTLIPAQMTGEVSHSGEFVSVSGKTGHIPVMVSLKFRNKAELCALLGELQNPGSDLYHHYLTRSQFAANFSVTLSQYRSVISYFESFGLKVCGYADRVSVSVCGTPAQIEEAFHTTLGCFKGSGKDFYAPVTSSYLPAGIASLISGISGLNDNSSLHIDPLFIQSGTTQYVTGTDFQNAYDIKALYERSGYPTNETIATILWSGNNSFGQSVAPFIPSDIYTYYSKVLPAGEPVPTVYGYPVLGAPPPGPSAATDSTGANVESTLDLEMAGSTAPGAKIIEVYGPEPTITDIDEAFASILNPNYNSSVDSALNNVSVISNSWGSTTCTNNTIWQQYEEESAARGITVLASSGDDGDSSTTTPSFPATLAYNNFGTVAVGGIQENLSGFQSYNGTGTTGIRSATVWYNSPSSGDGSQGGVSSYYPAPDWQVNSSDANSVIRQFSSVTGVSSGRGTPDIAADGANMLMYVTLDTGLGPSSGFVEVWGTSIASPLTAGLIASIDHFERSNEGFMDPIIYKLGQEEYNDQLQDFAPFYFVYNGSNAVFPAEHGYSLSVGWGSINAMNFAEIQEQLIMPTPPMDTIVYSQVNGPSIDYTPYFLPDAEEFQVGNSTVNITFISLYLYGPGTVNVSIGTSVFGSQVMGPMEVDLSNGSGWYNISIPSLTLPGPASYYLSVYGSSTAQWGNIYYANATIRINALRDFYYETKPPGGNPVGVPANDSLTPDLFTIGYHGVIGHYERYSLDVRESGLPAGYNWTVSVYNNEYHTTSSSIVTSLYNGSYLMTVTGSGGYHAVNFTNIVTISGKNTSITIEFSKSLFLIYFNETGLPAGTPWSVSINGTVSNSTGSSISFVLPYGTYTYRVLKVNGFFTTPVNGTIFLDSNTTIVIPFLSSSIARAEFAYVNASSLNTYFYALPGSQEFSVGTQNVEADYIDLYLKGDGRVNVSIGSNLLISNVVSNITLTVNSKAGSWYNITIKPTALSANISYYLNVWSLPGSSVLWGYTSSPSSSVNAQFAYWFYGKQLFMSRNLPDLFTIGYSIEAVYPP